MTRARLTPHQREVYKSLSRRSAHIAGGWVHSSFIGSPGALEKLVAKGWAERHEYSGPRGGVHVRYKPVMPAGGQSTE